MPMTIRKLHHCNEGSLKHRAKTLIKGETVWLRPATQSLQMMKALIDSVSQEHDTNYLEFMIHSSELMPGGSPYFKDKESIERLYTSMEQIFKYAQNMGYRGMTLHEYYMQYIAI